MNLRILVFFAIGLLIFFLDIGFNAEQDSKDIYISDQELTSLLSAWKSQVGRPPSDEEIVSIINNFVQEEILYREALLLELDQDCLLYTSPSPRDLSTSRMPSSA